VYDRARAAARYSATMRELVQSFKYHDRHEGLPLFARWLVKAGAELLADADLIVPVPLYSSRLWWRRFNQSAMLAHGVARLSGVGVDCFLPSGWGGRQVRWGSRPTRGGGTLPGRPSR
ncbi:MAG TPA: hypothetical protein VGN85_10360, partial [Methyloceanibacter sp.]|nr:hypothetical protein [Methyloceanibacter sp.]